MKINFLQDIPWGNWTTDAFLSELGWLINAISSDSVYPEFWFTLSVESSDSLARVLYEMDGAFDLVDGPFGGGRYFVRAVVWPDCEQPVVGAMLGKDVVSEHGLFVEGIPMAFELSLTGKPVRFSMIERIISSARKPMF
jgi:hypothetical protein